MILPFFCVNALIAFDGVIKINLCGRGRFYICPFCRIKSFMGRTAEDVGPYDFAN